MSNKQLWDQVCTTDPKAVKPITGKQYQGNSPKPYWLIERATEVFGPVGIGWGCNVKSERFERLGEFDVLHVAVVSVWYEWGGKRSETFDQMGGTKAAYKTSKGALMVDEDAGKKSVTDGMVKCLSMIGFAGDIFSGRWDDSKYVAQAGAILEEQRQRESESPEGDNGNAGSKAKAQAKRSATDPVQEIINGVTSGDASGAATYLAGLSQAKLDALWAKLPEPIQEQLTAAWPKETA